MLNRESLIELAKVDLEQGYSTKQNDAKLKFRRKEVKIYGSKGRI